jgi:hypothetical protein
MTTNNSIYICGPVSGTDDYVKRFEECEKRLRNDFAKVVNPVRECQNEFGNPESKKIKWNDLMMFCIDKLLYGSTHIYLMSGWEKSHGERIEQLWSEKLGLIEIREAK